MSRGHAPRGQGRIRNGRLAQVPRQRVGYPTGGLVASGVSSPFFLVLKLAASVHSPCLFSSSCFGSFLPPHRTSHLSGKDGRPTTTTGCRRRRSPAEGGGVDGVVAEGGGGAREARVDRRRRPADDAPQERR